jgi:hypothetical protein
MADFLPERGSYAKRVLERKNFDEIDSIIAKKLAEELEDIFRSWWIKQQRGFELRTGQKKKTRWYPNEIFSKANACFNLWHVYGVPHVEVLQRARLFLNGMVNERVFYLRHSNAFLMRLIELSKANAPEEISRLIIKEFPSLKKTPSKKRIELVTSYLQILQQSGFYRALKEPARRIHADLNAIFRDAKKRKYERLRRK